MGGLELGVSRKGLKSLFTLSFLGKIIITYFMGTSVVVQWLRFLAPNVGGLGLIPGQGTGSHMLKLNT